MTTVIRRRRAVAVLSVVLGLVLSSCATGPSQVNAAAIVDGRVIGVGQVQDIVDRAVKTVPAAKALADQHKLGDLSRRVLSLLVQHELITSYTARHPVTIDSAQVGPVVEQIKARIAQGQQPADGAAAAGQDLYTTALQAFDMDFLARDFLMIAAIGDQEWSTVKVTLDYAFLTPNAEGATGSVRDQAMAKAKQLAAGLDQATAVQKADTDKQAPEWTTASWTTTNSLQGAQTTALFGTPANTVVAFQANSDSGAWIIALVRKRETSAPAAGAEPGDTSFGVQVLQSKLSEFGVRISPRYGVYDQVAMGVAPSEVESAGFVLPVKVDAQP